MKKTRPVREAGALDCCYGRLPRPIVVRNPEKDGGMLREGSYDGPDQKMLITNEYRCSPSCNIQGACSVEAEGNPSLTVGCPHGNRDGNPLQEISLPIGAADYDCVKVVRSP